MFFLQPHLIGGYIIVSWGVLCKNKIVVFKVKITMQVENYGIFVYSVFCTTDLLATKLGVLITINKNQTKYNKVGIHWQ